MLIRKINSVKFKSNCYSINFIFDLTRKNASYISLLSRVLTHSTKKYNSFEELNKKIESLYGSLFDIDVNKYGDKLVLEIIFISPKNEYILEDIDLNMEVLGVLNEVLYNPDIEEFSFKEEVVEIEKQNLIYKIDSLIKDPLSYAMIKNMEITFDDKDFTTYKYGVKEIIKKISAKDLYQFYKYNIIESNSFEYLMGEFKDYYNDFFQKKYVKRKPKNFEFRTTKEKMDLYQDYLTINYYLDFDYDDNINLVMVLFSRILGGNADSLLFNEIREKLGLCYSISSNFDRALGILYINVSSSNSDYNSLVEAIDKVVINFDYYFKDYMLHDAKLGIISQLKLQEDSIIATVKKHFLNDLFLNKMETEEIIKRIEETTSSDILKVSKELKKISKYYIEGNK